MNSKTKFLKTAFLLACMLLAGTITASAYDFEVDGIYYNIDGTNATVTHKGTGSNYYYTYSGSVTIPATVTYNGTTYSVTSIGYMAFRGCSGLISVVIPNSVTSIGYYAFEECSGLTSVRIPNSVTSIGWAAFCWCSGLTSVGISNSVTSIDGYVFHGCSGLTSVSIPNSVISIGVDAFSDCSGLTNITIPDSVSSIGGAAFKGCSGLTSVVIPNSITSIGRDAFYGTAWYDNHPDGLVYAGLFAYKYKGTMPEGTSITIQQGTLGIADNAFEDCSGLTSVIIPNSVTFIGSRAFEGCLGLTSVIIPDSITSIGESSFTRCSGLTSLTIGSSVTSIGSNAFLGCSGLNNIEVSSDNAVYDSRGNCDAIIETASRTLILGCKETIIPNSVTSIGKSAFEGCLGLTSVVIPNSVTTLGRGSFRKTGLTSVVIPGSVKTIGNKAFMSCENLTDVTLSEGLTLIDEEAFCETGITEIHLPESLIRIGEQAFEETPLTSITIPKNVAYLGNEAEFENDLYAGVFDDCQQLMEVNVDSANATYASYDGMLLTKDMKTFLYCPGARTDQCVIPNTVTTIGGGWGGFDCKGLTSVIIPSNVEYIADGAFDDCDALTLVRIFAVNPPSVGDYPFSYYSYSIITLEVPAESVEAYRAHEYWSQFQNILPIVQTSGDTDGDGRVSIGDVTFLIDMLLNGHVSDNAAADVDGDGTVSIGDVTALIDMLLSGN